MTNKNVIIAGAIVTLLVFGGCTQVSDQAQTIKQNAEKQIGDIQTQYENTRNQVLDTKAQIDQKVDQAKDVVDAVGKLAQ